MASDTHGKSDGHGRRCDVHGDHGPLYPCPEYPKDVLDEIAAKSAKYVANLRSAAWCDKQIANGVSQEAIAVFRAMAGVSDDEITD